MVQDIDAKIMGAVVPEISQQIKAILEEAINNYDLGDQSLEGTLVDVKYYVGGGNTGASIDLHIESGKITGTQVIDVREYDRMGGSVAGHQREYVDKRVFRLPDGEYITSETIPEPILEQIVEIALSESE